MNQFLYIYTVLLNRTEEEFWATTPKRLFALIDAHVKHNTPSDDKKDKREVQYINHGTQYGKN